MAGSALGFFYQYYPPRSNGLADITVLLNDLKDRSQSLFWRRAIVVLLGSSWSGRLKVEQKLHAARVMQEMCKDSSENLLVKERAARECTSLFLGAYSENVLNDPNVKRAAEEKKLKRAELIEAARKVTLSPETQARDKAIRAEIEAAVRAQMRLFADKSLPAPMQISIIVGWSRYQKGGLAPPEVRQIMKEAVRNYKDYDEKLWSLLVFANVEDFGNEEAAAAVELMLGDVQDEAVRERLARMKTEYAKRRGGG